MQREFHRALVQFGDAIGEFLRRKQVLPRIRFRHRHRRILAVGDQADAKGRFGSGGTGGAAVTSKGQITIPLAIRRRLNLQPGTILDFDEKATCLKAAKYHNLEAMRSVVGCAKDQMPGISSAQWLEETRGPVELPQRKSV